MNPNLDICHLDDGATLNKELTAGDGQGHMSRPPASRTTPQ
jgi:hypothetical protein